MSIKVQSTYLLCLQVPLQNYGLLEVYSRSAVQLWLYVFVHHVLQQRRALGAAAHAQTALKSVGGHAGSDRTVPR